MKRTWLFLRLAGTLVLLGFALALGAVMEASLARRIAAAPANAPAPTPSDFYSQEFLSSTEIVPLSGIAQGGLGDALLKSAVWSTLLDRQRRQGCLEVASRAIQIARIDQAGGFWVEDWTVQACGRTTVFQVTFRPDPVGGTLYSIAP